ncbi:hypothetical protein ACFL6C_02710 [Myxococcota bacterium]
MAQAAGVTGRVFDLARQLLAIGGGARKGESEAAGINERRQQEANHSEDDNKASVDASRSATFSATRQEFGSVTPCGRCDADAGE